MLLVFFTLNPNDPPSPRSDPLSLFTDASARDSDPALEIVRAQSVRFSTCRCAYKGLAGASVFSFFQQAPHGPMSLLPFPVPLRYKAIVSGGF